MRKVFVVASSIQPRTGTFTYSPTRSFFDTDERYRQTIFTINSIRNAVPDAKIVVVDSSEDYKEKQFVLSTYLGVEFIPIKELSGEVFETVNTHKNKSLCECLLLNTYYTQYKKQLMEYDFIIKATGRYFYFGIDNSYFTEENTDKIFFKRPLKFDWDNSWNYELVDARQYHNENVLHQYCTVLFGSASQHFHKLMDINEATIHLLNQPSMIHYDIETLSYYFTRFYKQHILEVDWMVSGWDGTSGRFMYY